MEPGSYPPPPPPGGPSGAPPLPWENRQSLGFGTALIETIKLVITAPVEAFRRAKESGDLASPLLFAIIVGWIGAIAGQIWGLIFGGSMAAFLPSDMQEQMGFLLAGSAASAVVQMILAPIYIIIGLFIASGIIHLCLMMVGGLSDSQAGFEGTVRAVGYSYVAQLANIIPFLGGFIALVWAVILYVIGLTALHRTTTGKAVAAVLIPLAVCCLCGVIAFLAFAGAIAGMIGAAGAAGN